MSYIWIGCTSVKILDLIFRPNKAKRSEYTTLISLMGNWVSIYDKNEKTFGSMYAFENFLT